MVGRFEINDRSSVYKKFSVALNIRSDLLIDLDWYKTRPNLRHARSVDLFMMAIVKGVTGVMFTRPN